MTLEMVLVFVAIASAVLDNALRGRRIRARDRHPFYVGTAWMVVFVVAIPHGPVLGHLGWRSSVASPPCTAS